MSSRETLKHTISVTEPVGASIGDEWYNPAAPTLLYKRVVKNNIVGWSSLNLDATASAGTVTSVNMTVPTGLTVSGNPITTSGTLALTLTAGYSIPTTTSQSNWDTAYTDRNKWDGGSTGLVAATGRTSLGATTLGGNLFTLTNVAAISFPRINADNTVSTLDAATFRTAIGAGTSSTTGTVTSVGGTGTVSGLTLTGTVTSSGNLTLGGTLSVTASNFASQTANTVLIAPNGSAGVPTFRALVAADIPTLNQNTTGTSANVTGTVAVANGGTGATTAAAARTNLGATTLGGNLITLANVAAIAFPRINADNTITTLDAATFRTAIGAGTSSTTGTVTSVGGTGTVSGLTLTGTVTSTGSLTLGGTLSVAASNFASQTANTVLVAPNGAAGVPTFRALVAADLPTITVAKGGTGLTAIAARSILVANTADTYTTLTPAAGQSIRVNAGNTAWEVYTPSAGGGVTSFSAGTTGLTPSTATTGVVTLAGTLALANGGTGATTAAAARTNLGLGSAATQSTSSGGGVGVPLVNADGTFEISRYIDFHAAGGDAVDYTVRLDGGAAGSTTLNLVGSFTASGNVTAYSDERLKTNWLSLPENFVTNLALLKSGTYTRLDSNERQAGSSAQDWQKLLPEVVTSSERGILSLAYGNAALVSAIELAKEVVSLRDKLAHLEALVQKILESK